MQFPIRRRQRIAAGGDTINLINHAGLRKVIDGRQVDLLRDGWPASPKIFSKN